MDAEINTDVNNKSNGSYDELDNIIVNEYSNSIHFNAGVNPKTMSMLIDKLLMLENKILKKEKKLKRKISDLNKDDEDEEKNKDKLTNDDKKRVYVINFNGDIRASATENLRQEITAILSIANIEKDEVVVNLESPGGMVHGYGLAASQLARIREHQLPLTICVDKVAASGGYMMACLANNIIAAPFAVIGSIGVVAQLPNFHRLLDKWDIDYEVLTAGEYKRTLTMFGKNTDAGREKFIADLEDTHTLFKDFVTEYRPQLDIEKVATGEHWYGKQALGLGLVDKLMTSDEYLLNLSKTADVFAVRFVHKQNLMQKVGLTASTTLDNVLLKWWERLTQKPKF